MTIWNNHTINRHNRGCSYVNLSWGCFVFLWYIYMHVHSILSYYIVNKNKIYSRINLFNGPFGCQANLLNHKVIKMSSCWSVDNLGVTLSNIMDLSEKMISLSILSYQVLKPKKLLQNFVQRNLCYYHNQDCWVCDTKQKHIAFSKSFVLQVYDFVC